MALPSSGPLGINQIYNFAVDFGYAGPKSLSGLSTWSGWTTANPNGSLPHAISEFLSADCVSTTNNNFTVTVNWSFKNTGSSNITTSIFSSSIVIRYRNYTNANGAGPGFSILTGAGSITPGSTLSGSNNIACSIPNNLFELILEINLSNITNRSTFNNLNIFLSRTPLAPLSRTDTNIVGENGGTWNGEYHIMKSNTRSMLSGIYDVSNAFVAESDPLISNGGSHTINLDIEMFN